MNKELLNELASKRLEIEKELVIQETILNKIGKEWDDKKSHITKLKLERQRLSMDIRLVCSEKDPKHSEQYKPKKKKK